MFIRALPFLFASLPQRFVYASFAASGGTCPVIDADDYVSCAPDSNSTASSCDTCTCMSTRKLEHNIFEEYSASSINLRGSNDGRALQYEKTDGKGWGWDDCKYL